jgi:hypothetical protein
MPDNPAEEVAAIAGAAISAIGDAAQRLTTIGNDLDVEEKKKAQPVAVALVISQVASAATAAAVASGKVKRDS